MNTLLLKVYLIVLNLCNKILVKHSFLLKKPVKNLKLRQQLLTLCNINTSLVYESKNYILFECYVCILTHLCPKNVFKLRFTYK